jgi:hypothetical protein
LQEDRLKIQPSAIALVLAGSLAASSAMSEQRHNRSHDETAGGRQNPNQSGRTGAVKAGDTPAKPNHATTDAGHAGESRKNSGEDHHHNGIHAGTFSGPVPLDAVRTDNVIVAHPHLDAKKKLDLVRKPATTSSIAASHGDTLKSPNGVGGPARNAIGSAINAADPKRIGDDKISAKGADPGSPRPGSTLNGTGSSRPLFRPVAAVHPTTNGGGINGSSISRPGLTPGTIGGAAKNVASVGGTSFRQPKR